METPTPSITLKKIFDDTAADDATKGKQIVLDFPRTPVAQVAPPEPDGFDDDC